MNTILLQIKLLLKIITLTRRQLLIQIAKDHLGVDASPLDRASDEFGCAESVTEILVKAGMFDRVITGTWTLYDALNKDRHWTLTDKPEPGCIVLSPTGESRKGKRAPIVGHVGIVIENDMILSSDSYTGKWAAHYSIKTWRDRYETYGGYPMLYYKYI